SLADADQLLAKHRLERAVAGQTQQRRIAGLVDAQAVWKGVVADAQGRVVALGEPLDRGDRRLDLELAEVELTRPLEQDQREAAAIGELEHQLDPLGLAVWLGRARGRQPVVELVDLDRKAG